MRHAAPKSMKEKLKADKMRSASIKKKKVQCRSHDTGPSQTISFVIKGKLTPIKSSVNLRRKVAEKPIKRIATTKTTKMKERQNKKQKPKLQAKVKKAPKMAKVKKILKEPLKAIKAEEKMKPGKSAPRPLKKAVKLGKSKQVKTKPEDITREIKQEIITEAEGSERKKDPVDPKSKETIEKLLKEANKALKQPRSKSIKKTLSKKNNTKEIKTSLKSGKFKMTKLKDKVKRLGKNKKDSPVEVKKKKAVLSTNTQKKDKKTVKSKPLLVKSKSKEGKDKCLGSWTGPKRHRVASLNALAKVHCLYENETRSNILDQIEAIKSEPESEPPTRTLRSLPGLRAVGKHWDFESSSESDSSEVEKKPKEEKQETEEELEAKKPIKKRKRNRTEIFMDLKDMVVRKRMASLNATAILAASYSVEKRSMRSPKSGDSSDTDSSEEYFTVRETDEEKDAMRKKCLGDVKVEDESKVIEVHAAPNKKVAVILNQDTDVTITGVYVNSTTRSTHHEGFCSIAGMQYRISATSHTQTAATAVATETLLQSSSSSAPDNSNSDSLPSSKSYTPLDALSNMQPPPGPDMHGQPHMGPPQHVLSMQPHQLSPGIRHGCSSAFSSPHVPSYHPHPGHRHPKPEPGYIHGKCLQIALFPNLIPFQYFIS